MTERVHVVARVRPFISSDPPDADLVTLVMDKTHVSVGDHRVFSVDRAYMMEDDVSLLFTESVQPLIAHFLSGFNVSILAYGQTGTGKTYTIQGLLPQILQQIVASEPPASSSSTGEVAAAMSLLEEVRVQYIEVYGETLHDLLSEADGGRSGAGVPAPHRGAGLDLVLPRSLSPHHCSHHPLQPSGSAGSPTTVTARTVAEVMHWVAAGQDRRATGATNVHEQSSRSHALLSLWHPRRGCRLDVVDLAGSERVKKTGNTGLRLRESVAINTGLLALGNVIRALSRNARRMELGEAAGHVPYRSSKLTRLLQDSLGGDSKTLFIACVAPDSLNRDESIRTLQYSALALRVLNKPLPNFETLRQAQTPHGAVGFTGGAGGAKRDMQEAAVDRGTAGLTLAELQLLVAEQEDAFAALWEDCTTVKSRLALCEEELHKDEIIFSRQLHVIQQLVQENKQLRRQLAHGMPPGAMSNNEAALSRGGSAISVLRQMQKGNAAGPGQDPAECHRADAVPQRSAGVLPCVGTDNVDLATLRQSLDDGDRRVAALPEGVPLSSHSPPSMLRDEGRRPKEAGKQNVLHDSSGEQTAGEPMKSFIRDILRVHGIDVNGNEEPRQLPEHRSSPITLADAPLNQPSLSMELHQDPLLPREAAQRGAGKTSSNTTTNRSLMPQLAETPSSASSLANAASLPGLSRQPSTWMAALAAMAPQECSTGGCHTIQPDSSAYHTVAQRDEQLISLAKEAMQCHDANATLRAELKLVQAALDAQRREAAVLRLELQDAHDTYAIGYDANRR